MKPTRQLHDLGQSLWLDNITREILDNGTLGRYIHDYSVTGLTSNPTIFDEAIGKGASYDRDIREKSARGQSGESIFADLALDDLRRAADLFQPEFARTDGVDGWVSMEVSPLLAADAGGTLQEAKKIFAAARRPNLFVKIPGTPEGVVAIEEAIFAGVPINVTLLFSREQYLAAADAYMRGIERRIAASLNPRVESVASLFISRWDKSVAEIVPPELRNRLGIAIGQRTYRAYLDVLASPRWRKLSDAGARPQRLLWASTGTKDPKVSESLYVEAFAAPQTIDTMPEKTLLAFDKSGVLRGPMPKDGAEGERELARFKQAGIDVDALARQLQTEGAASFVKSWNQLMQRIEQKSHALASA